MRPIVWTLDALGDLHSIIAYISQDSAQNAQLVKDRIERCVTLLVSEHLGKPGRVAGTFEINVAMTRYIIAYMLQMSPDHREQAVVLHIIHSARNWQAGTWPKN